MFQSGGGTYCILSEQFATFDLHLALSSTCDSPSSYHGKLSDKQNKPDEDSWWILNPQWDRELPTQHVKTDSGGLSRWHHWKVQQSWRWSLECKEQNKTQKTSWSSTVHSPFSSYLDSVLPLDSDENWEERVRLMLCNFPSFKSKWYASFNFLGLQLDLPVWPLVRNDVSYNPRTIGRLQIHYSCDPWLHNIWTIIGENIHILRRW